MNPDTDGPTVVYDGIEAKAYAKVTPPGTDWTDVDDLAENKPTIVVKLLDNTSGITGTSFDTHPGS